MKEASKAMRRRLGEDARSEFPWLKIMSGVGLDVGSGDDPIHVGQVTAFDKHDGDANQLSRYFPDESFDFIHASQLVEHLHDPHASLVDWAKLVKPGGHIIFSVPEAGLYGDILWKRGPQYNSDHKATFSMWYRGSPAPRHYYVPVWIPILQVDTGMTARISRIVDTNYDYKKLWTVDQTFPESAGVEAFLEFVLQK
jgi:SAM-dependent methyltransferase